jgi:hypothetical protein
MNTYGIKSLGGLLGLALISGAAAQPAYAGFYVSVGVGSGGYYCPPPSYYSGYCAPAYPAYSYRVVNDPFCGAGYYYGGCSPAYVPQYYSSRHVRSVYYVPPSCGTAYYGGSRRVYVSKSRHDDDHRYRSYSRGHSRHRGRHDD